MNKPSTIAKSRPITAARASSLTDKAIRPILLGFDPLSRLEECIQENASNGKRKAFFGQYSPWSGPFLTKVKRAVATLRRRGFDVTLSSDGPRKSEGTPALIEVRW